jgi:hypothetical protein
MISEGLPAKTVAVVGEGTYHILVGACRIARARRAARIGTDDILVSMIRRTPELGGVLGFPAPSSSTRNESTSIYRLADFGTERKVEALGVMRQAHWEVFGVSPQSHAGRVGKANDPEWDIEAVVAFERSLAAAKSAGLSWVGNHFLLDELVADVEGAAMKLLREHRVNMEMLDEAARRAWSAGTRDRPRLEMVDYLAYWGLLMDVDASNSGRHRSKWLSKFTSIFADSSVILAILERAAIIEAVRVGHVKVSIAHLILSVLRFEEEITASGFHFLPPYAQVNAPVLSTRGCSYRHCLEVVSRIDPVGPTAPRKSRRPWRADSRNPVWTANAAEVADRARGLAGGGSMAGSIHLLESALSGADDQGESLLRLFRLDPAEVRADIAQRLRA